MTNLDGVPCIHPSLGTHGLCKGGGGVFTGAAGQTFAAFGCKKRKQEATVPMVHTMRATAACSFA